MRGVALKLVKGGAVPGVPFCTSDEAPAMSDPCPAKD
jgi:hypothetical protein